MNKHQMTISCVVVALLAGVSGLANAQEAKPAKQVKATAQAAKPPAAPQAISTKQASTKQASTKQASTKQASTPKTGAGTTEPTTPSAVPQAQPVADSAPAKIGSNPFLQAQANNPYLAGNANAYSNPNPYLAGNGNAHSNPNPYLAGHPVNPWLAHQAMTSQQAVAPQTVAVKGSGRRHISLSPLPVDIYMNPGMRPAVAFTTPCATVAKLTNNFPPLMAFESLMFQTIGKVNETEVLPFSIEPVCT